MTERPWPKGVGFGVLLVLALAGGAWVGPSLLATPVGHTSMEFADGAKMFCEDGGVMDAGIYHPSDDKGDWHPTAEEAVRSFEAEIRSFAADAAFSDEARELLAPSLNFKVDQEPSLTRDGVAYFDTTSNSEEFLEARVVVEKGEFGWRVSESFRCESTIVTDYARWERAYNDAFRGESTPLKDYDELGDQDE